MERYICLPCIVFDEPNLTNLYKTQIKYVDLQTYFLSMKCAAAEFIKSTDYLLNTVPFHGETVPIFEQHLNNAKRSFKSQVAFISGGYNDFFAEWKSDALKLVQKKMNELRILKVDFSQWVDSKSKAEDLIMKHLDDEENSLYGLEKRLAHDQWEVLELKKMLDRIKE